MTAAINELLIKRIDLLLREAEKKETGFPKTQLVKLIHDYFRIVKTITLSKQNVADKRVGYLSEDNVFVIIQSLHLSDCSNEHWPNQKSSVLHSILIFEDVNDPMEKITRITQENSTYFELFAEEKEETIS